MIDSQLQFCAEKSSYLVTLIYPRFGIIHLSPQVHKVILLLSISILFICSPSRSHEGYVRRLLLTVFNRSYGCAFLGNYLPWAVSERHLMHLS